MKGPVRSGRAFVIGVAMRQHSEASDSFSTIIHQFSFFW